MLAAIALKTPCHKSFKCSECSAWVVGGVKGHTFSFDAHSSTASLLQIESALLSTSRRALPLSRKSKLQAGPKSLPCRIVALMR